MVLRRASGTGLDRQLFLWNQGLWTSCGGVAVLFSKSFTPFSFEVEEIMCGRMLMFNVRYEHVKIISVNVYGSVLSTDQLFFFKCFV